MRSIQFSRFGEPADVLEVKETHVPEPGPHEVLVKMAMRPVHPADLALIRGLYGVKPELPAVPGMEGAGVVEAIGPDVTYTIGTRLAVMGLGTWQEYVVIHEEMTIPVPDDISFEAACQAFVNPVTAIAMLDDLGLQPDQWLLQTAAGSALGQMIVRIAQRRGIKTINVVRREEWVDYLKKLGADEVVVSEGEDLVDRVMKITGGEGVPGALDAVGGEAGTQVVKCLSRHGVLLGYGMLSGRPIEADNSDLIFKQVVIRGFWLSEWFSKASPQTRQAITRQALEMLINAEIQVSVEAVYGLDHVKEAVQHVERHGRHGKILLA